MGKISDKINSMIQRALESAEMSSANPTHINRLIQINEREDQDFEQDIRQIVKEDQPQQQEDKKPDLKQEEKIEDTIETVDDFKVGNVGQIQDFTTSQIGNVSAFARNPFQFIVGSVFRKAVKGAGFALLVIALFEVVKVIMEELFKPGRAFDVRFRERIEDQILSFFARKEQQELKQGLKQVITTTIVGLRGEALRGQIGGNFFTPNRLSKDFLRKRVKEDNPVSQNAQMATFQRKAGR